MLDKIEPIKHYMSINLEAIIYAAYERLKAIPGLGDSIAFLQAKNNIIEMNGVHRAIELISEGLNVLATENKLNYNYIKENQREIYFLFKFFLMAAYNQLSEEYIGLLSKFVENCFNEEFSECKLKVIFLNKLAKYTKQHIEILKSIYLDNVEHTDNGKVNHNENSLEKQVQKIEIKDKVITEYCLNELQSDGFLYQQVGFFQSSNYSPYQLTLAGIQCLKMINII